MPIYLCKPGCSAPEPWRHGLQVYAYPFRIDEASTNRTSPNSPSNAVPMSAATTAEIIPEKRDQESEGGQYRKSKYRGMPIRRIRHAEVVLVDEVCAYYGRYWLRLCWPGPQGGFAGYIALGAVTEGESPGVRASSSSSVVLVNQVDGFRRLSTMISDGEGSPSPPSGGEADGERTSPSTREVDVSSSEALVSLSASNHGNNSSIDENTPLIRCPTTGLYYPSSSAMQLLHLYDDGLSSLKEEGVGGIRMSLSSLGHDDGEPVFCRICREGLHDVNYDLGAATAREDEPSSSATTSPPLVTHSTTTQNPSQSTPFPSEDEGSPPPNPENRHLTDLIHQATSTHPTAENPLLAPCECSGSIAFVHYLCIEQWRCRSRHPAARNGLHCETCGGAYTLPPPPSRPVQDRADNAGPLLDDDWLEAMPAHVLAALRRPHICWQIGAAVVRRKWLRPLAPIIISPIVALYCRSRRMLKKRGVSRRRWACSLCRRRARWKCVRCLRSYYCSRQCQNVSWHIVHKHVCYKPLRFTWSVAVYGAGALFFVPGIWKDPLVYVTGLALLPLCFIVVGILTGGIASLNKKFFKTDFRGRLLEIEVVLVTSILAYTGWGIVWAFFGRDKDQCVGLSPPLHSVTITQCLYRAFFSPVNTTLKFFDRMILSSAPFLCTSKEQFCFERIHNTNPDLLLEQNKCSSDVVILFMLYVCAALVMFVGTISKRGNRERRNNAAAVGRGAGRGGGARIVFVDRGGNAAVRPHQD